MVQVTTVSTQIQQPVNVKYALKEPTRISILLHSAHPAHAYTLLPRKEAPVDHSVVRIFLFHTIWSVSSLALLSCQGVKQFLTWANEIVIFKDFEKNSIIVVQLLSNTCLLFRVLLSYVVSIKNIVL